MTHHAVTDPTAGERARQIIRNPGADTADSRSHRSPVRPPLFRLHVQEVEPGGRAHAGEPCATAVATDREVVSSVSELGTACRLQRRPGPSIARGACLGARPGARG